MIPLVLEKRHMATMDSSHDRITCTRVALSGARATRQHKKKIGGESLARTMRIKAVLIYSIISRVLDVQLAYEPREKKLYWGRI